MSQVAASVFYSAQSQAARPRVLVLESNTGLLEYIRTALGDQYNLLLFSKNDSLLRELTTQRLPDIILLAWDGVERSLSVLQKVLETAPKVPLLLLSCTADSREIGKVMRMGAQGIILKPFNGKDLESVVEKHLIRGKDQSGLLHLPSEAKEIPIGEGRFFVRASERMRDVEEQGSLVAQSDIPVLILGESGTGKEVIAMYIHKMSARSKNMFLKVNCAAMPADLLESELFGYEQGAFTGAVKTKPGKFETCAGGTIFLDEIGEMPALLQAKLLQVLQDGTFSRLGGRTSMKADVRVVAATNINMKEAMARKTFREDLYYRLNGFTLTLPPLRERREEVMLLASHFMRRGAEKYNRAPLPFPPALQQAFQQYSWPGNLRELENVVNRYLILSDERAILADLREMASTPAAAAIAPATQAAGTEPVEADLPAAASEDLGLKQIVRSLKGDAEAAAISNALKESGWNRKVAASNLKISYKALLYKIKNYNLAPR